MVLFDMISLSSAIKFISSFTDVSDVEVTVRLVDEIWNIVGETDVSSYILQNSYNTGAKRNLLTSISCKNGISEEQAQEILLDEANSILKELDIDYSRVSLDDIILSFYHATSSIDNCSDIVEQGLFPLDKCLGLKNHLTDFLKEYGIFFDFDRKVVFKKTEVGFIEKEFQLDKLEFLGNSGNYLQQRFKNDCYINGVWCPFDHLGIFNQTSRYLNSPEFLKHIGIIFEQENLEWNWEKRKESYLLKCSIPLRDLDIQSVRTLGLPFNEEEFLEAVYTDDIKLKKCLVRLAFERLIEGAFADNKNNIVHIKKHIPGNRIDFIPLVFIEGYGYISKEDFYESKK